MAIKRKTNKKNKNKLRKITRKIQRGGFKRNSRSQKPPNHPW